MKTISRRTEESEHRGCRFSQMQESRAATGRADGWNAFEFLPQPVHIMTEDGVIVAVNRSFEELFGTPRRRLVGRHMAILNTYSVAANLRLLQQIREEIASCAAWQGTFRNQRADGTFFTTRVLIHPMRVAGRRYFACFQENAHQEAPAGAAQRCTSASVVRAGST